MRGINRACVYYAGATTPIHGLRMCSQQLSLVQCTTPCLRENTYYTTQPMYRLLKLHVAMAVDVSSSSEALSAASNGEFIPENLWIFTNAPENDVWLELKWLEEYQPSWGVLLVVCAVAVYFAWYYLLVVAKPRLVGGGTTFRKHILNHCPILSHYYYPTFWAPNCHFTTIGRAKLQKCPEVTYDRYEF